MTRTIVTPAYVTPEKRAQHDMLADLCRAHKLAGRSITTPKRHKRYMALREAFAQMEG